MPVASQDRSITADRQKQICAMIPRVERIARQVCRRIPSHIRWDDLVSAGTVGMIEAVDRFDADKCDSIERYADIRIRGAILDELRSMDWATRSLRRQTADLQATIVALSQTLGRTPQPEEIARRLELSIEQYHAMMKRIRPVLVLSFEDVGARTSTNNRRDALQIIENPKAIDPSAVLQRKRLYDLMEEHIKELPERSRMVVTLYHFEHLTLKQIGKILGVTESRVSQILSAAVKTVRAAIQKRVGREGVQLED